MKFEIFPSEKCLPYFHLFWVLRHDSFENFSLFNLNQILFLIKIHWKIRNFQKTHRDDTQERWHEIWIWKLFLKILGVLSPWCNYFFLNIGKLGKHKHRIVKAKYESFYSHIIPAKTGSLVRHVPARFWWCSSIFTSKQFNQLYTMFGGSIDIRCSRGNSRSSRIWSRVHWMPTTP